MVVLLLSLISFKLLWCWTSFSLWQWTCYLCLTSVINLSTVKCLCTYTFTWTPYSCPSHRCVLFQSAFFSPLLSLPCCSVLGQVLCHGPVAEPLGDKLLEAEGSSYTVIAFEWAVGQLQAKVLGLPNPLHTAEMWAGISAGFFTSC